MWKFQCNNCTYSFKEFEKPNYRKCAQCSSDDFVVLDESFDSKDKEVHEKIKKQFESFKKEYPQFYERLEKGSKEAKDLLDELTRFKRANPCPTCGRVKRKMSCPLKCDEYH